MAIDPQDITLSPDQRRRLAEIADRTGRPWPDVLAEVIASYRPNGGTASSPSLGESFYDAMKDVIGIVKDAPPDLSSNPKHLEGFGRDCDPGAN